MRCAVASLAAVTVATASAPTAVADPLNPIPGNGVFLVGPDIAPGQYRVNPSGGSAYWARLDANLEIIDNDLQDGQSIVVVDASDFALRINGTLERIG